MNLEEDWSATVELEIGTSPDVKQVPLSELAVTQVRRKRIGVPLTRSRKHSLLASQRHVRRRDGYSVVRVSVGRTKFVDKGTFEHDAVIFGHAMQMEKASP